MNEGREGAAHKLKPAVSKTTLSLTNLKPVVRSTHGSVYGNIYFLDLGNLTVGLRVLTEGGSGHRD